MTGSLFDRLAGPVGPVDTFLPGDVTDDELHLALYCLYELHYRGFAGVDAGWEWEPSLLDVRRQLETRFEADLTAAAGAGPVAPSDTVEELWKLARSGDGPSLSAWVAQQATIGHVRELFVHRSAYQLKEADPHTWAIPRMPGAAKAVMVAIQADEYGGGQASEMHSTLFARTMAAVGLDPTPNAYLDAIPGYTLATTNLISMFGLHRRWRGALVGHLALFEMTSTGPMARYSDALRRLGVAAPARKFFDVHVVADEHHQHMATDGMVAGLLAAEPDLAGDVAFGARCLSLVEGRFAESVLGAWRTGRTSLTAAAGTRAA